jgi:hypothetical protein
METARRAAMSHILRPPSEKTFKIADALAGIPRCLLLLESAVNDVISEPRDDDARIKVRDQARSLRAGCLECGFRESSNLLRSLESTLPFLPRNSPNLHRSVADRLMEILAMLKAKAQAKGEKE